MKSLSILTHKYSKAFILKTRKKRGAYIIVSKGTLYFKYVSK